MNLALTGGETGDGVGYPSTSRHRVAYPLLVDHLAAVLIASYEPMTYCVGCEDCSWTHNGETTTDESVAQSWVAEHVGTPRLRLVRSS